MTTLAERRLHAIRSLADALAANHLVYLATEAALADTILRAGVASGGGRSSDISDPTASYATMLTDRGPDRDTTGSYPEFEAEAETALRILRRMQTRQTAILRQRPELAREAEAVRNAIKCDGSVDPTCTGNAVRGGVCWRCIKKTQRAATTTECGHVHSDLLGNATSVARPGADNPPVERTSAMRYATISCPCGWTSSADGHDETVLHARLNEALDAHKAAVH